MLHHKRAVGVGAAPGSHRARLWAPSLPTHSRAFSPRWPQVATVPVKGASGQLASPLHLHLQPQQLACKAAAASARCVGHTHVPPRPRAPMGPSAAAHALMRASTDECRHALHALCTGAASPLAATLSHPQLALSRAAPEAAAAARCAVLAPWSPLARPTLAKRQWWWAPGRLAARRRWCWRGKGSLSMWVVRGVPARVAACAPVP